MVFRIQIIKAGNKQKMTVVQLLAIISGYKYTFINSLGNNTMHNQASCIRYLDVDC